MGYEEKPHAWTKKLYGPKTPDERDFLERKCACVQHYLKQCETDAIFSIFEHGLDDYYQQYLEAMRLANDGVLPHEDQALADEIRINAEIREERRKTKMYAEWVRERGIIWFRAYCDSHDMDYDYWMGRINRAPEDIMSRRERRKTWLIGYLSDREDHHVDEVRASAVSASLIPSLIDDPEGHRLGWADIKSIASEIGASKPADGKDYGYWRLPSYLAPLSIVRMAKS